MPHTWTTPEGPVDPRVLGHLLLVQTTLHVLPTQGAIGEFLCRALADVPGVREAGFCLDDELVARSGSFGACAQPGSGPAGGRRRSRAGRCPTCPLGDAGALHVVPLRTIQRTYGRIVLELDDASAFTAYRAHVANLANTVAMAVETRHLQDELARVNADLTQEVAERTAAQGQLAEAHRLLEHTVEDRTAKLLERERQLRETQENLFQAQKLESLGRLAGGVAHDFNNLLTAILGFTELAANFPHGPDIAECLGEIAGAAQRAADLTKQLLAFARRQPAAPKVIDLNSHVVQLAGMLRRLIGEDIQLRTELGADLWPVMLDPGHLGQLLANLAVNARDAMPGGGTLVVRTRNVRAPESAGADDGAAPGRDQVQLIVSDTGSGMSEATRARIFEPFFTTKAIGRGTGLGLASCHGIVEQSGGRITVDSRQGEGSTFTISLPRAAGTAAEHPPAVAPAATPGSETVLLVEDEDAIRAVVARTLQAAGYRVLEAADGQEALSIGLAHLNEIDLLVTDVVMPRLGGWDLARALLDARGDLRVLFVSGYPDRADRPDLSDGPRIDRLQKPFLPRDLTARVRQLLDRPVTLPAVPARPRS